MMFMQQSFVMKCKTNKQTNKLEFHFSVHCQSYTPSIKQQFCARGFFEYKLICCREVVFQVLQFSSLMKKKERKDFLSFNLIHGMQSPQLVELLHSA